MQQRRALIFAGGTLDPCGPQAVLTRGPWDWILCADSGARHALAMGHHPNLLVGDFDSISEADRERLSAVPTLRFSTDKGKTDTHLAVDWALEQGADYILVAAGLGTRFDHSLANAQLLVAIHGINSGRVTMVEGRSIVGQTAETNKTTETFARATGVITDGRQAVYLLADTLEFQTAPGMALSILPLTPRLEGLTLRGLRWELDNQTVTLGETLTVSNEFTHQTAWLTLGDGLALVIVAPQD